MYALFAITLFVLMPLQPRQNQYQTIQPQDKTANAAKNTSQNLPALPQSPANPTQENTNRNDGHSQPQLYWGLTRGEWVSAILTLAYVGISLLAFFAIKKQANLTEQQSESSKDQFSKQIAELTKSSNAMENIASRIERGNIDITRAYLVVVIGTAVYQERREGQDDLYFSVRPLLINTGSTPARKICIRITADILPIPVPDDFGFPVPEVTVNDAGIVGTHKEYGLSATLNRFVPDEEVPAIKEGRDRALCAWGLITYEDMYGKPHSTRFGQWITWWTNGNVFGYYLAGQNDFD